MAHINTDRLYEAYTSGAIENLKAYIDVNAPEGFPGGWSTSPLAMQQTSEDIYGLPFHDGPECLIYRKGLFRDENELKRYFEMFGKPLQLPETWHDFNQVARFF